MKKPLVALLLGGAQLAFAHDEVRVPVPQHYVVRPHCTPGRGFFAAPRAPDHTTNLPFMAVLVFDNEVIGFLFEVHEKEGWKPWYDQSQGRPIRHGDGPPHYSQTIMIRKGPTPEQCKAAAK